MTKPREELRELQGAILTVLLGHSTNVVLAALASVTTHALVQAPNSVEPYFAKVRELLDAHYREDPMNGIDCATIIAEAHAFARSRGQTTVGVQRLLFERLAAHLGAAIDSSTTRRRIITDGLTFEELPQPKATHS